MMHRGIEDLWFVGIPKEADYITFSDGTGNIYEERLEEDSYYNLYAMGWMNYESLNEMSAFAGSWADETEDGVYILNVGADEAGKLTKGELYTLLKKKWNTNEATSGLVNYKKYYGGFKYGETILNSKNLESSASAGLEAGKTYDVCTAMITKTYGVPDGEKWTKKVSFKVVEVASKDVITLKGNSTSYQVSINTQTYEGLRSAILDTAVDNIQDGSGNTVEKDKATVTFHHKKSNTFLGLSDVDEYLELNDTNLAKFIESEDKSYFKITYGTADQVVISVTFVNNQSQGSYTIKENWDFNVPVNGYILSWNDVKNQADTISAYILSNAIENEYAHASKPIVQMYGSTISGKAWIEYSEVSALSYSDVAPEKEQSVRIHWATTDTYAEMNYEFTVKYVESRKSATITLEDDDSIFAADTEEEFKTAVKEAVKIKDGDGTDISSESALGINLKSVTFTKNEDGTYSVEARPLYAGATWTNDNVAETFTVTWKVNEYTVEFVDANGNEITGSEQTLPYGSKITLPSTPVKEPTVEKQYVFLGWKATGSDAEPAKELVVKGNATYEPVFEEKTREYQITWKAGEGVWADEVKEKTTSVAYGQMPTAPENPSYKNYIFDGWSPDLTAVIEDTVYTAKWKPGHDINNNGIPDENETAYVKVTVEGSGTVTLNAAEGVKTVITLKEDEQGAYVIVYDSNVENGNVIYVTATPNDTDSSDGSVDYVAEAPESFVLTTENTVESPKEISVKFATEAIQISKTGTIFINGRTDKKLSGLKAKILDAAFGAGNYNANEYTVYTTVDLGILGEKEYDISTTKSSEQAILIGVLNVGSERVFRIEKQGTHTVSDTINVMLEDSRYIINVAYDPEKVITKDDGTKEISISAKEEPENPSVQEQIKNAITITYDDPQTETEEKLQVSWDDITISYGGYKWPNDGEAASYTVTLSLYSSLSETYQNSLSEQLTLKVEDTTVFYNVTYMDGTDANGGNELATYEAAENTSIPSYKITDIDGNLEDGVPTRQYYLFTGWELTEDTKDNEVSNAEGGKTINGNLVYVAQWRPEHDNNKNDIADEEESYTVVYESGYSNAGGLEGSFVLKQFEPQKWGTATPVYDADENTDGIQNPTRGGYNFLGWNPTVAEKIEAPTAENSTTITYTAQWTKEWVVTFKGHTYNTPATVVENGTVNEPIDTYDENHYFLGWFKEGAEEKFDFTTAITGNITLTAKWVEDYNHNQKDDSTEEHFTVKYVVDGVETTYADILTGMQTPSYNKEAPDAVPMKDGYIFKGWDPEVAEKVENNVTYTAQWSNDKNKNGVDDAEETITLNLIKANDADKVSIANIVESVSGEDTAAKEVILIEKSTSNETTENTTEDTTEDKSEENTDEENKITVYSCIYDSTKTNLKLSLKATPVVNLEDLKYKSATYVASVVLKNEETAENAGEQKDASKAEQQTNEPQSLEGSYDEDYVYTCNLSPAKNQTVTVTFKEAKFDLKDSRIMNYYTGMKGVTNDALYNAIVNTPAYADATEYTIKYKARDAKKETVQLSSLGLDNTVLEILKLVNITSFDFSMSELWLDADVETEGKVKDSLTLDQAVSKYLTVEKINSLVSVYTEAYNAAYKKAYEEAGGDKKPITALAKAIEAGLAAGTAAVQDEIDAIYTNVYNAAMYNGAHNFGYNAGDAETVTEVIKITYKNKAMYIETETDIELKDMREPSYIKGTDVSVMYRDYTDEDLVAAVGAYVTDADGTKIDTNADALYSVEIKNDISYVGKNVSDEGYKITFRFTGNEEYRPSENTFTVKVTQAPLTMDLPNINVTYGTEYSTAPTFEFGNAYPLESEVTDSMIQFLIGLDAADADIDENGITGLNSKLQLILPKKYQETLNALIGITGGNIEDGVEMSISELLEALKTVSGDSLEVLQQFLEAIQEVVETSDITIVVGGTYPTNIGTYLYGAVSTNSNYETAYDIGYIIIKPKTTEVYLDWNFKDSNGVFTRELLQYADFGASAFDDEAFTTKNEKATEKIQNLIFGIDSDGELVIDFNKTGSLKNGAYTQLAFIADFGNTLYYAVPLVRAFAIIPNTVNVKIVDQEETSFKRTFDGEPQTVDVEVKYEEGTLFTPQSDKIKITYTGVQTSAAAYNSTEAPTDAGAYIVTATYVEKDDNGNVLAVGMDIRPMLVIPAKAEIEVKNDVIVYESESHKFSDYITVTPNSETVDVTVISAGIASTGDFSENGWAAVEGNVNIDFPTWIDELLNKNESFQNGMNAKELAKLLNKYEADLLTMIQEIGLKESQTETLVNAMETMLDNITALLEQMPENITLTFKDDAEFTSVGAYVLVGIVTDTNYMPTMDTGVLVVIPKVTETELKWNYEDGNNIWTRELLKIVDLNAKAFEKAEEGKEAEENKEATEKIKYQFIGFDTDGKFVVINDSASLPNGVFAEMAYIPLEAGGEMTISNMISRIITITPGVAEIKFVDENGEENPERVFTFDNKSKEMNAKVWVGENEIEPAEGTLTVTYYGIQTNGEIYKKTEAPTHAGMYAVTAEYKTYTEDNILACYGVAAGAMLIQPTTSEITVTGKTVSYDGKGHTAEVKSSSETAEDMTPAYTLISGHVNVQGNIDEIGVDAFTANVNIDFPGWVDELLEDYSFKKEGVTPEYLIKFMTQHKEEILALLPTELLEKAGVDEEKIEEITAQMEAVYENTIKVLEKMPKNVSLTFKDDVTYTEPGNYLYYGIVTDLDHMPSADTGLLQITKLPYKYDILDTYVPYNGEAKEPDLISETMDNQPLSTDRFTIIVDREKNTVNLQLEDDLMYLLKEIEKVTGLDFKNGITIEELYKKLPVEDLAEQILTAIENMEADTVIDQESDLGKMIEMLKKELTSLPEDGKIIVNGSSPTDAGTYEFYVLAYSEYYETQISKAVLNILPIYITADDEAKEKVYGMEDPDLTEGITYSYYSYQGGEKNYLDAGKDWDSVKADFDITKDAANKVELTALPKNVDVTTIVTTEVTRTSGEDVGLYDMDVALTLKDTSGNYKVGDIEQDKEDFKITKAPLTIKVKDAEKIYGEIDPVFACEITEGRLAERDKNLTFKVERTPGEDVNADGYEMDVVLLDEAGKELYPNYGITVEKGTFNIKQRALTITVKDADKTYGDEDPAAYVYEVSGNLVKDIITVTPEREEGENVSSYDIIVPDEQLEKYPNYNITVNKGTFTINKRNVVITIKDASKVYGDADPSGYNGFEVSNIVEGDTLKVDIYRSNEDSNDAGCYQDVLTADLEKVNEEPYNSNYQVTEIIPGDFTIIPRALTIIAIDAQDRTYQKDNKKVDVLVTVKGMIPGNEEDTSELWAEARISGDNAGNYWGIRNLALKAGKNYSYDITEDIKNAMWEETVEIYPVKVRAVLADDDNSDMFNKVYDGTRNLVVSKEAVLVMEIAEDQTLPETYTLPEELKITYSYGAYDAKSVGDRTVTIAGIRLERAKDSVLNLKNYEVVNKKITKAAEITPLELVFKAYADSDEILAYTYNGNDMEASVMEGVEYWIKQYADDATKGYAVEAADGKAIPDALDSIVKFESKVSDTESHVYEITITSISENYVVSEEEQTVKLKLLPLEVNMVITSEIGTERTGEGQSGYEVTYGSVETMDDFKLRYTLNTDGVAFKENLTFAELQKLLGLEENIDYRTGETETFAVSETPYSLGYDAEKFKKENPNSLIQITSVENCEVYITPMKLSVTFKDALACGRDEIDKYLSDNTNLFTAETIEKIVNLPYGDTLKVTLGDKQTDTKAANQVEYGCYDLKVDICKKDSEESVLSNYILTKTPDSPSVEVKKPTQIEKTQLVAVMTVKDKVYDGTKTVKAEDVTFTLYEASGDYAGGIEQTTGAEEPIIVEGLKVVPYKVVFDDEDVCYDAGGNVTEIDVTAYGLKLQLADGSQKDLDEYELVSTVCEGKGKIVPKQITVTGLKAVDRPYEADRLDVVIECGEAAFADAPTEKNTNTSEDTDTENTQVGNEKNDPIISRDQVGMEVTGSLLENPDSADVDTKKAAAAAGEGKSVYLTMTLTGADKGNYALAVPTDVKVNITKAEITVVNPGEIERPSRGHSIPVSITIGEENPNYNASLTWVDGNNAKVEATIFDIGRYTAKVTLTPNDADNYQFALSDECEQELAADGWTILRDADENIQFGENGELILTRSYSIEEVSVKASSIEKASSKQAVGIQSLKNSNASTENEPFYTGDVVTASTELSTTNTVYSFKGWYGGDENGPDYDQKLSSNVEYTFTVEGSTHLWAVYEAMEKVRLRIHGPEFTISTIDGVVQTDEYIGYYAVGTQITLTGEYADNEFLYWKNDSEKIVSKSQTYTFTLVRETDLELVYNTSKSRGYAKVEFVTDTGQVLSVANYTKNQLIEYPQIKPSKTGYTFEGWSMDGANEVTDKNIWDAIKNGETWIRVEPLFKFLEQKCSLMVQYDNQSEDDDVILGKSYTISAKSIDGKKFSHWSDSSQDGNVLSTSEKYTFMVTGNMELYAIYVGMDEEVVKRPTIAITDISVSEDPKKLSFSIIRDVPDGYELILHGSLFTTSKEYEGDDVEEKLIDGASGVTVKKSQSIVPKGIFIQNFTVDSDKVVKDENTKVYVRGYMYVRNLSTGLYEVIYSNVVSGSYNTLKNK